jgi:hypothetical protein
MFEGDFADTEANNSGCVDGGKTEQSSVRRRWARTPIGVSGNLPRLRQRPVPRMNPCIRHLSWNVHLNRTHYFPNYFFEKLGCFSNYDKSQHTLHLNKSKYSWKKIISRFQIVRLKKNEWSLSKIIHPHFGILSYLKFFNWLWSDKQLYSNAYL